MRETLLKNRTRIIVIAVLLFLFLSASQGMEPNDWIITVLRGLAVGAITFLVASGFSLILGLMDVLNLAHGELFMLGAYIGWTVYIRPDTFVDGLTPLTLLAVGLVLMPVIGIWLGRMSTPSSVLRFWPWASLLAAVGILAFTFLRWPISIWDPEEYALSPVTFALAFDQGTLQLPEPVPFAEISPLLMILGTLLGGLLLAAAIIGLRRMRRSGPGSTHTGRGPYLIAAGLLVIGLFTFAYNDSLTEWIFNLSTNWRFALAILVATIVGGILGALVETTLIRPLYDRPIYQIMLTLGLSFIGIEIVRSVWGRPEFTMPKPELFSGTGAGCNNEVIAIAERLANNCSTIFLFDGRVRTYNEIFIILVGLIVLVSVWLLLQRTRLGMIIRAGVQDSEMVEALGINVRRVFTLVFGLGVALAALGGVLAAPSIGLSTNMGTTFLLLALIALAIGGLTSFPGAAAGAVLVGLIQQFIIKYGQIGINLPFLAEPFKPSPPLVPASTVLLMVIILLILPHGLFGREE